MATRIEHSFSEAPHSVNDTELVLRIVKAYYVAQSEFGGHGSGFWATFEVRHHEFKAALLAHDYGALAGLLRDPSENEFLWGFDGLVKEFTKLYLAQSPSQLSHTVRLYYDILVQLAIGVGALRCPYPEAGQSLPEQPVEDVLSALDSSFGFKIDFPNPYRREFGLATSRGIASYRALQALYQTWRVSQLAKFLGGGRLLEIGAGLGRNAYYAQKFGLTKYTIIDIPATQIAQGYFLGRVLGERSISLCGESDRNVRIRGPNWLQRADEKFDVAVNADSLTELDGDHARAYLAFIRKNCGLFLSINHEFNATTAAELFREAGMIPLMRSPYWPRAGYVEELVVGSQYQSLTERPPGSRPMTASRRMMKSIRRALGSK